RSRSRRYAATVDGQTSFDRQVIEETLDLLGERVSSRHGPGGTQLNPSTIADSGVNVIAWASATPGLVISPAIALTPTARAASSRTASSRPLAAIRSAYGSVTLVRAYVEVFGTAPGMFPTQ